MKSNPDKIRPVWVIIEREIQDQIRDWRIVLPVIALTVFFPLLMNFTADQAMNLVHRYHIDVIAEQVIPFFMMIVGFFPVSVSLIIALESFVGEKERGSIEPLLNTPLKNWQLYAGKLLSSIIPSLFASFLGMGVYLIGLLLQGYQLPVPELLFPILALTIMQALVMVSGAVIVSSQTTSVRAANLLASFIIIPVALLIQLESIVIFSGNYPVLWIFVFGLTILTIMLVRIGLAHFKREELLGREFDVLNLHFGWHLFWDEFTGSARNAIDWYLRILPETIKRLLQPSIFMVIMIIFAIWLGISQVNRFSGDIVRSSAVVNNNLRTLVSEWPVFSFTPVLAIWWQNLRALLLSFVLGVFTFGILGVVPQIATFGLLGFIMGEIVKNGASIWMYLVGFILPHGLLEIPAVILAGAAILQMGAIMAAPSPGKTISEVWITTLADWCKVMIGAVIPMLFVAAAIEAWVTPHIALLLLN